MLQILPVKLEGNVATITFVPDVGEPAVEVYTLDQDDRPVKEQLADVILEIERRYPNGEQPAARYLDAATGKTVPERKAEDAIAAALAPPESEEE